LHVLPISLNAANVSDHRADGPKERIMKNPNDTTEAHDVAGAIGSGASLGSTCSGCEHLHLKSQRNTELAMMQFINACQPSLCPDEYDSLIAICRTLESRTAVLPGATDRVLDHLMKAFDV
jgi:hypothetical protein